MTHSLSRARLAVLLLVNPFVIINVLLVIGLLVSYVCHDPSLNQHHVTRYTLSPQQHHVHVRGTDTRMTSYEPRQLVKGDIVGPQFHLVERMTQSTQDMILHACDSLPEPSSTSTSTSISVSLFSYRTQPFMSDAMCITPTSHMTPTSLAPMLMAPSRSSHMMWEQLVSTGSTHIPLLSPPSHAPNYSLYHRVGRGACGELWRAMRMNDPLVYVLKRLFLHKGEHIKYSGMREMYFGTRINDIQHIHKHHPHTHAHSHTHTSPSQYHSHDNHEDDHMSQYIESFEQEGELWLVFVWGGVSLSSHLMSISRDGTTSGNEQWKRMRRDMMEDTDPSATPSDSTPSDAVDTPIIIVSPTTNTSHDDHALPPPQHVIDQINETQDIWQHALDLPNIDVPARPIDVNDHSLATLVAPTTTSTSTSTGTSKGTATPHPALDDPTHPHTIPMPVSRSGSMLRDFIHQLVTAVASLHEHGIIHRDLKPANLLIDVGTATLQTTGVDASMGHVRICDFGSAIDLDVDESSAYAASHASRNDLTLAYAPPEVLFGDMIGIHPSYDIWSCGIIILEMILGTSHVFQVNARTRAMLETRLAHQSRDVIERAVLFRAMMEYCIYPTATYPCDEREFMTRIRSVDPLGVGITDIWLIRLVRRLLTWHPEHRITASQALQHAYFTQPYRCDICAREFEMRMEWINHRRWHATMMETNTNIKQLRDAVGASVEHHNHKHPIISNKSQIDTDPDADTESETDIDVPIT